ALAGGVHPFIPGCLAVNVGDPHGPARDLHIFDQEVEMREVHVTSPGVRSVGAFGPRWRAGGRSSREVRISLRSIGGRDGARCGTGGSACRTGSGARVATGGCSTKPVAATGCEEGYK